VSKVCASRNVKDAGLPILESYWDRLQALHEGVERAIEGLPLAAVDWVPGPGMNSLGVLVTHVAGAERYWIGDVVGRHPSGRDRGAEFRARGVGVSALKGRLAETLAHSRAVLDKLALPDLEALRVSPRDGRKFTVAWSLAHALEHTALHLGHIQITRQLWEQREQK
jgi:uncharacterized damage-inducible protein DinB